MSRVASNRADAWYNESQQQQTASETGQQEEYEVEYDQTQQYQDPYDPSQQYDGQQQSYAYAEEAKEPSPAAQHQSPPPTAVAGNKYYQQQQQQQQFQPADASAPHDNNPPSASLAEDLSSSSPNLFDPASLDAAAHRAIESDDEIVVSQFLQMLEQHRAQCEQNSMYVEAQLAKDKIEQLRQHDSSRRLHALSVRHVAERLDLEEAHILEFDEFNALWTREHFARFDEETQRKQQALLMRHVEELEQWTQREQDQFLVRPKFSKQLLQLRAMQEAFAKSRDYANAERVRVQANQLEALELGSLKYSWSSKIEGKRSRFLETQRKEIDSYVYRRREERTKLEQKKLHDLRVLIVQKYKNLKAELESTQAKEKAKLEKMRDLGISGSSFLREQAPKHRNYSSLSREGYHTGGPTSPSHTNGYSASSRIGTGLRAESSALRKRRIEEEEEEMLRSGGGEQYHDGMESQATQVPTISGALSSRGNPNAAAHHQQSPGTARAASTTNSAGQPSTNQLLNNRQTPPTRPATSHAYDMSGRRPHQVRPHRALPVHYSRPPTRGGGDAMSRAAELQAILQGTNGPRPASRSHTPHGSASRGKTPLQSPGASPSVPARRASGEKTFLNTSLYAPAKLPSLAQTRAIEAQRAAMAEERRLKAEAQQAELKKNSSTRSMSSDDDF